MILKDDYRDENMFTVIERTITEIKKQDYNDEKTRL